MLHDVRGNYLCAIENYTHFLYATGPTCHTHTKKNSLLPLNGTQGMVINFDGT